MTSIPNLETAGGIGFAQVAGIDGIFHLLAARQLGDALCHRLLYLFERGAGNDALSNARQMPVTARTARPARLMFKTACR